MNDSIKHFYEFEGFRLDTQNPSLWRNEKLVSLPPKSLEILILLVEKNGEIVSRENLLETVWKDTFVEEGSINYTISLLRKTLGNKDFIQTVPRRGYRFAADVRKVFPKDEAETIYPENDSVSKNQPSAKPPKRPVLFAVGLISVLFLTSFTFFSLRGKHRNVSVSNRNFKTLAILPLKNLNENEPNEAFSLGLTDSLISRFGSLNRLTVRPFDAVEKYTKDKKDPLQFGEELKADVVLEGTFQTIGNRLRVNVRLLDVRDGAQIWTTNFDETEEDIFKLQNNLAAQLAKSLTAQLSQRDEEILGKHYTENPEAYRAYLHGRTIFEQRGSDEFERMIDEFQKAVALDPTFALAYTGFADAFTRRGNVLSGRESAEAYKKARMYADKALQLDADLAEGYASRGRVRRLFDWDWDGAEADFRRAVELNPNYAAAHLWNAQMFSFRGRHDEALAEITKAVEINPISPIFVNAQAAILESRGDFDEGLKHAENLAHFDKGSPTAKRSVATFLFHKGEYAEVIEMSEEMLAKNTAQKFVWFSLLSTACRRTNQIEKADASLNQLEELAQTDTKALYSLAVNYAEAGRTDEAAATLQKCFYLREERMSWVNVEPRLANLRNDWRFQEIVQMMKLN